MLLIWTGWGILVLPIVLGTALLVGAALQALLTALQAEHLSALSFSLGLFAGAAANWVTGKRMNSDPGRELQDVATGQRVVLRRQHKLFWIPMQYWSIPVALAACVPLLAILRLLMGG